MRCGSAANDARRDNRVPSDHPEVIVYHRCSDASGKHPCGRCRGRRSAPNPGGYMQIMVNGTTRNMPYY